MKEWIDDLLSIVFPRTCRLCESPLADHEKFVCESCKGNLTRTLWHAKPSNPMELRFAAYRQLERASALLFYSRGSDSARILQEIKYHDTPSLGTEMGRMAYRELFSTGFFSDVDFLVPVPIHFTKRMRRGYNQTEYICKGISEESGIPQCTQLKAVRSHATQTHKTMEERRRNVAGSFRLKNAASLAGCHLMIVDDVCTTGATLQAAAEAIIDAQPDIRLSFFTLAVTQ